MMRWNVLHFTMAAMVVVVELFSSAMASEPMAENAPSSGTFSTITFEGSALFETGRDDFQDFWDPGFGGELAVVTPVPYGFLELAAHPFANRPREKDLPRIRTLGTYLGWGIDIHLPQRFLLRASARTGVFWMLYDATADRQAQDENEMALGARASLQYSLAPSWSIHAGVRAARVLTRKEIDFVFAGGGLAYTFSSPGWLRGFLE